MTSEARLLIIINNAAAKARRAWPIVRQHLEAAGVHFDFYETTRPGDATIRTAYRRERGRHDERETCERGDGRDERACRPA